VKERESEFLKWFLIFLFLAFLINIGVLVLIHEEPRRGIITFEMLKSQNFLQPTVLGEPYYKKPPLHNWILAFFSLILGGVKEISLRLPSSIAVILTSLVIFITGRKLVGREGALAGALIYPTFFIVLIGYGTKCEPDTLFTLLVSTASLLWLYFMEEERKLLAWTLGYTFTALALLTKGLPSIQFFLVTVISYGIVTGKWRELLSRENLFGALVGLSPFILWLLAVKGDVAVKTLFSEVISRAPGKVPLTKAVKNYLSFPLRLVSATLPWSLVLLYYGYKRKLKLNLGKAEKVLITAFLIDSLIYWLFPGSRLRYLMPALPLLSIVIGALLGEVQILHKRAKEVLRFTAEVVVLVGIVGGVIASKNPSLTLKETLIFIPFLYGVYFFLAPRLNITRVVFLWAVLMLIFRGFYSSYFLPIAQYKYPPVREVAEEIVNDSKGFKLYTKTKYLQLDFYVERGRNEILKFTENPPADSLFITQRKEGNVLKEYKLGKHTFYLSSYSIRELPTKRQSGEGLQKQNPEKRNRSKEKSESLQG